MSRSLLYIKVILIKVHMILKMLIKVDKHAELQRTALKDKTAKKLFYDTFVIRDKNGNSFHNLQKKKKRREME